MEWGDGFLLRQGIKKLFQFIGIKVHHFFLEWGEITLFSGKILSRILFGKSHIKRTVDQMVSLGIYSLSIVTITAIFVGMAFTVQVVREFLKFGAGKMVGGVVGLAVWRELGPLLSGVVFAGRVGAAISAELGTMKVTEQVDALETMSQDPIDYLVVPRVLACSFMLPLLVGIADIIGFFSGLVVALSSGQINLHAYFDSASSMLKPIDIYGGLIKAFLFGLITAILCSYMGIKTQGGAKGVGETTTKAVVISLITIFILNYFLSLGVF